jgi:molybdopterin-binding protein
MRFRTIESRSSSFTAGPRGPKVMPCRCGVARHNTLTLEKTMSITAINVRNQFRGRIREVIEGPVVSEIDVETPSGLLVTSVITTRSIKELGLVVGKEVIALVKATEVSIATL